VETGLSVLVGLFFPVDFCWSLFFGIFVFSFRLGALCPEWAPFFFPFVVGIPGTCRTGRIVDPVGPGWPAALALAGESGGHRAGIYFLGTVFACVIEDLIVDFSDDIYVRFIAFLWSNRLSFYFGRGGFVFSVVGKSWSFFFFLLPPSPLFCPRPPAGRICVLCAYEYASGK